MSLSEKSTYRFLETIRIVYGEVQLLDLHQRRMNHTFSYFFSDCQPLNLTSLIDTSQLKDQALVKCRLRYNATDYELDYQTYQRQQIKELVILEHDLSYPFKYLDRGELNELKASVNHDQEPLICTRGRIRETTYGNVLLRIDGEWKTPLYPIFYGVMRSHVLNEGLAVEADLFMQDYLQCDQIKIINAMMPMESCLTLYLE